FDGRRGRAMVRGHLSGKARRTDHRRFTRRPASPMASAAMAMASAGARWQAARAALGAGHHPQISSLAAGYLPDSGAARTTRAQGCDAATQWALGISLRSGDSRMAKASRANEASESEVSQTADADPARRGEHVGCAASCAPDASQGAG